MSLVFTVQLAVDCVTRTVFSRARRAACLDDKIRYDAVESQAVVEFPLDQLDEIGHGPRRTFRKEFDLKRSLLGDDPRFFRHFACFRARLHRAVRPVVRVYKIRPTARGANPIWCLVKKVVHISCYRSPRPARRQSVYRNCT